MLLQQMCHSSLSSGEWLVRRFYRAAGDADRAAVRQGGDERPLRRCRIAAVRTEEVDRSMHRLRALDVEGEQIAARELVLDHEPRDEADPETGLHRALDRLVGVELPALARAVADA